MKTQMNDKFTRKRKAFALIVAIGAMAFIVMLTLTLSAVISSKLRLMTAQKEMNAARSNALLGLSVAISELQTRLGKDNAITFPSSIFDSKPNTLAIDEVEVPYVIGTMSIDKDDYTRLTHKEVFDDRKEFLAEIRNGLKSSKGDIYWLASSSQKLVNPVIERMESLSDETIKISEFNTLSDYPNQLGGDVSKSLKSEKVRVMVGKIPITGDDGMSGGSYAWYVSDESLKAKINLTRPEKYLEEITDTPSKFAAPADMRLPQISNTSFISELSDVVLNPFIDNYDDEMAKLLAKVSNLDELTLINPELETWAKENKNDWTTVSVGLPVDVTQGRLKEDLGVYLFSGNGLNDSDSIIRGSSNDIDYVGPKFEITNYNENLPRFGQLKNWANIATNKDNFNDTVPVEVWSTTGSSPKHGIYPVVARASFFFLPCYSSAGNTPDSPITVSLMMWPKITLWNPNNVGLASTDYVISLYCPFTLMITKDSAIIGRSEYENSPKINTKIVSAYTSWVKFESVPGPDGNPMWSEDEDAKLEKLEYDSRERESNKFDNFISQESDSGVPIMSFRVNGLSMKPGESVELNISPNATKDNEGIAVYRDVPPNSLGGNDNLMEPGIVGIDSSALDIISKKCIRVRIGGSNTDLEIKPPNPLTITPEEDGAGTFTYNPDTKYFENASIPTVRYQSMHTEQKYVLGEDVDVGDSPIIQAFWRITGSADPTGSTSSRVGFELFKASGGFERIMVNDLSEWININTTSKEASRDDGYRYNDNHGIHGFHRTNVLLDYTYLWGGDTVFGRPGGFESGALPKAFNLYDKNFNEDSFKNGLIQYYVRGKRDDGRPNSGTASDAFTYISPQNSNGANPSAFNKMGSLVFSFSFHDLRNNYSLIYTAHNIRATSTINGTYNSSSVIHRPASLAGSRRNYAIGQKFHILERSINSFGMGNSNQNWTSSRNGTTLTGSYISSSDDFITASSGDSNRFGVVPIMLSGRVGVFSFYQYHGVAMFDYPRSEDDLMSLGMLSHANMSPMLWYPSVAFGDNFGSPYLDRDETAYDHGASYRIYENECIDISYMVNVSMWDRFYMSSLPQSGSTKYTTGMRLPNTRYFLTSVPETTTDFVRTEKAFKESAAYVAIDGPFNVNSTSYEAWRAFLGGMLGTQKKTLTGQTINSERNDYKNPERYRMPNPGAMNPVTKPFDVTSTQGKFYNFKDQMVGRTIAEDEIDLLAREVVAEVKRRAPFFGLADFVNRRLETYQYVVLKRDASDNAVNPDLDEHYNGIMGTLSAAIHRASHDNRFGSTRYKEMFNSKLLEESMNGNMSSTTDIRTRITPTFVAQINKASLTSYDSDWLDPGQPMPNGEYGNGGVKDLGEMLKTRKQDGNARHQHYEHAIRGPWVDGDWATKMEGMPGLLNQRDILSMIAPFITTRGDTFTVRAYGESKNPMTGNISKAYCEAVVQRSVQPIEGSDDIVAPESPFGRRFNIVSFRWLTPAEL